MRHAPIARTLAAEVVPAVGTATSRAADGCTLGGRQAAPSTRAARAGRLRISSSRPPRRSFLLMQSRNVAARAGRWSAQHRKTAILGWILFVVLATVIGGRIGQKNVDESASGNGESKRGDMIVEA